MAAGAQVRRLTRPRHRLNVREMAWERKADGFISELDGWLVTEREVVRIARTLSVADSAEVKAEQSKRLQDAQQVSDREWDTLKTRYKGFRTANDDSDWLARHKLLFGEIPGIVKGSMHEVQSAKALRLVCRGKSRRHCLVLSLPSFTVLVISSTCRSVMLSVKS